MRHFSKLFFLTLLLPLFSMAQNYQPGAVVNLKGDTLYGFINYGDWDNMPKRISFKSAQNNAIVKFSAADIKYYNPFYLSLYTMRTFYKLLFTLFLLPLFSTRRRWVHLL